MRLLVPVLLGVPGGGVLLFMCRGSGDYMTARKSTLNLPQEAVRGGAASVLVLPEGAWTMFTLTSALLDGLRT